MMFMGMAPMGALLAGILADHIGAPWTVRIGGTVCVIGAGLFALALPQLRREARQIIIAQQMTGGSPANEMTGEAVILPNSSSNSDNHPDR
jgi:hypothetical protein